MCVRVANAVWFCRRALSILISQDPEDPGTNPQWEPFVSFPLCYLPVSPMSLSTNMYVHPGAAGKLTCCRRGAPTLLYTSVCITPSLLSAEFPLVPFVCSSCKQESKQCFYIISTGMVPGVSALCSLPFTVRSSSFPKQIEIHLLEKEIMMLKTQTKFIFTLLNGYKSICCCWLIIYTK